jgi:hypothetical protein
VVEHHLLVLLRVERLIVRHVLAALAIAVGVEDERRPALTAFLVFRLLEGSRVEPADDAGPDHAGAGPQHVVLREIQVVRGKAGADQRP